MTQNKLTQLIFKFPLLGLSDRIVIQKISTNIYTFVTRQKQSYGMHTLLHDFLFEVFKLKPFKIGTKS